MALPTNQLFHSTAQTMETRSKGKEKRVHELPVSAHSVVGVYSLQKYLPTYLPVLHEKAVSPTPLSRGVTIAQHPD